MSRTELFLTVVAVAAGCHGRDSCYNHGNCMNAECQCDWGYRGDRCETAWCVHGDRSNSGGCQCLYPRKLSEGVCQLNCGGHGNYSQDTGKCSCDPGWKTAGITDTIAYIEGRCSQYGCSSDGVCQSRLGLPGASCPIHGWNCYCGMGHFGYDHGDARCMSFMYALSFTVTDGILGLMRYLWRWVLVLTCLLLPIGHVRTRCPHRRSWLVRSGCQTTTCQGECTLRHPWRELGCVARWEDVRDEFAWSLWAVKLGIWSYLTLASIYLVFMTIWSLVLWLMVGVVLLVMCCLVLCGCARDGNSSGDCECDRCCCLPGYYSSDRTTTSQMGNTTVINHYHTAIFWDPYYTVPDQCCSNSCDNCGSCCTETCCCAWLWRWLVGIFPDYPHNRAGGLLGYLVGTHPNRLTYQGTSCCLDRLLGLTANRDYRHHDQLMESVRGSLKPVQVPRPSAPPLEPDRVIGGVRIWRDEFTVFGKGDLISGSYDDYCNNECPICLDSIELANWARLSCGHAVCESCCERMLHYSVPETGQRVGYPCFACRQVFRTVTIRGPYRVFAESYGSGMVRSDTSVVL
jgi:hypothetical protein